jgi:hypothetical protein
MDPKNGTKIDSKIPPKCPNDLLLNFTVHYNFDHFLNFMPHLNFQLSAIFANFFKIEDEVKGNRGSLRSHWGNSQKPMKLKKAVA